MRYRLLILLSGPVAITVPVLVAPSPGREARHKAGRADADEEGPVLMRALGDRRLRITFRGIRRPPPRSRTAAVADFLNYYNHERRHSALDWQPPVSRTPANGGFMSPEPDASSVAKYSCTIGVGG